MGPSLGPVGGSGGLCLSLGPGVACADTDVSGSRWANLTKEVQNLYCETNH